MCFSATASFAVAAGTGLVGVATARQVSGWREIPLASIPLIFAVQQAVEGMLWLGLAKGGPVLPVGALATSFAFFALVIWPLWAPLAAGLVERETGRRLAMAGLFILAIPVAYFGFVNLSVHPYNVCIVQHTLSYDNGHPYPTLLIDAYIVCTCCPALLSSFRSLQLFGAIVVTGLIVSAFFYLEAFFSVWCFFAAAASIMVYLHFAKGRAQAGMKTNTV